MKSFLILTFLTLFSLSCATPTKVVKKPLVVKVPTTQVTSNQINWNVPSEVKLLKNKNKIYLIYLTSPNCHWCQFQDQSFQDPEVMFLVNRYFYPIKVITDNHPKLSKAINAEGTTPFLYFFTIFDVMFIPGFTPMIDGSKVEGYLPKEELIKILRAKVDEKFQAPASAFPQP